MKIVHVVATYLDEYRYQDELLPKTQAALGHGVTVITPIEIAIGFYQMKEEDYRKTEPYVNDGVKVIRLDQRYKFLGWRFAVIKDLYRKIEEEKPDLLYVHKIQGFDVLTACKYKEDHPDCCVVVDSHAEYNNTSSNWVSRVLLHKGVWRVVARRAQKKLDRIYHITPWAGDFIKEMHGLSDAKLAPTYLGGDMSSLAHVDRAGVRKTIRQQLSVGEKDRLLVTAGKIDEKKKTHVLLDALNRLNDPSIHLVVIGSMVKEYEPELRKLSRTNPRIHFTGFLPSEKILEYFLASDLGVFPGRQSALWQEAICCGLPCIFKKHPGCEYLNPGGNAVFLSGDDPDVLQKLLRSLISDRPRLDSMRNAALTKGVERFDYRNIAQEIIEFASDRSRWA